MEDILRQRSLDPVRWHRYVTLESPKFFTKRLLVASVSTHLHRSIRLLNRLLNGAVHRRCNRNFLSGVRRVHGNTGTSHHNSVSTRLDTDLGRLDRSRLLPITQTFGRFLGLTGVTRRCRLVRHHRRSRPTPFRTQILPRLLTHLHNRNRDTRSLTQRLKQLRVRLILATRPARITQHALVRGCSTVTTRLTTRSRHSLADTRHRRVRTGLRHLVTRT